MTFPFVKGHGTGNDFVVLPDLDGSMHGDLDPALVIALCDRRQGIGADGVLRVLRSHDGPAPWFMDYRNADGSVSEMCGNGVRVFARYLEEYGLLEVGSRSEPLFVDTRDGVKSVTFCLDGELSVDMGSAVVGDAVQVSAGGQRYEARRVDLGNPHAVVFVDDVAAVGDLRTSPYFCGVEFASGVNVEFVQRISDDPPELVMRVFERGVGETMSCGTGACAAVAAAQAAEGAAGDTAHTSVHVPGGVLTVSADGDGHLHLKGAAVLVAEGTWRR